MVLFTGPPNETQHCICHVLQTGDLVFLQDLGPTWYKRVRHTSPQVSTAAAVATTYNLQTQIQQIGGIA